MRRVENKIGLLTDLFLGAAYADASFTEDERNYIRKLLADLLCVEELPEYLDKRIESFDIQKFDLLQAANEFAKEPPMSKRRLLELVGQVNSADNYLDLAEDDYLRALAKALAVPEEEYADLVLDYEVEELRESFNDLVGLSEFLANK